MTQVGGGRPKNSSLIAGRDKRLFSSPDHPHLLWAHKISDSLGNTDLFQKVKQPGREANGSTPCSAEGKNELSKMYWLHIISQCLSRAECTSELLQQLKCVLETQPLGLALEYVC